MDKGLGNLTNMRRTIPKRPEKSALSKHDNNNFSVNVLGSLYTEMLGSWLDRSLHTSVDVFQYHASGTSCLSIQRNDFSQEVSCAGHLVIDALLGP